MASRSGVGIGRKEPCAKCVLPVFLAERLNVGSKLYHRTCFRCARCKTQLSLANCYETENDGVFCCETCPDEEADEIESKEPATNMLSSSVSDEQKSRSLQRMEQDAYSTNFETALEESPINRSRKEFWNSHLLTEEDIDNMDILVEEISPENKLKSESESPQTETQKDASKTKSSEGLNVSDETDKPASSKFNQTHDDDVSFKVKMTSSDSESAESNVEVIKKPTAVSKFGFISKEESLLKVQSGLDDTTKLKGNFENQPKGRASPISSKLEAFLAKSKEDQSKNKSASEVDLSGIKRSPANANFTKRSSEILNKQTTPERELIHRTSQHDWSHKRTSSPPNILETASPSKKFHEDLVLNSKVPLKLHVIESPAVETDTLLNKSSEDLILKQKDELPQKLDPPDLDSLTTEPQSVNSVKNSVINKTDQHNAALVLENNVTKEPNSLIKSRMLIFENVPSNDNNKTPKNNVPLLKTNPNISDNENVPSEKILKYFGPQSASQEKLKPKRDTRKSHELDEKALKDVEAVSKYFGPKKVTFDKTASAQNLSSASEEPKKHLFRIRSKSKSYTDLSDNESYHTAFSNESKVFSSDSSFNTPPNMDNRPASTPYSEPPKIHLEPPKVDSTHQNTNASILKLELHKEMERSREELREEITKYESDFHERLQKSKEDISDSKPVPPKITPRKISSESNKSLDDSTSEVSNLDSKSDKEISNTENPRRDSSENSGSRLNLATSIPEPSLTPIFTDESSKDEYPDELNPFGSDDENAEPSTSLKVVKPSAEDSALSPLSSKSEDSFLKLLKLSKSDDSILSPISSKSGDSFTIGRPPQVPKILMAPRISLNPFWSDDEEPSDEEIVPKPTPLPRR